MASSEEHELPLSRTVQAFLGEKLGEGFASNPKLMVETHGYASRLRRWEMWQ